MGSSLSESRVSAFPRFPGSKGLPGTPSPGWLEKAAQVCRRFNHRRIAGFAAEELQADEIRTFAGNKKTPSWVFVTIEVWSRLWPSTVTGRRSYRNTHALFRDLSRRMNFERLPLIVTDRIRILPEGHPSLLRSSVSLRPGPKNAQERSHHQGRTQSAARSRVAIRRRAQ